jgi:hypothetical protein
LRPDSAEPIHIGADFWPRLMSGKLGDFHHEYLVTTFSYDKDWPNWEMHPNGDEIVMLLDGETTLVLEIDGGEKVIELNESCAYVVVARGTGAPARARGTRHGPLDCAACCSSRPAKALRTGQTKPSPLIPLTARLTYL